jgi:hypothetical protein
VPRSRGAGTIAAAASNDTPSGTSATERDGRRGHSRATPRPVLDSDSLLPTLKGAEEKDRWKRKSPLYWESREGTTAQAVRFGKWKAIRSPMLTGEIELYDMSNDAAEKRDYSKRRPDLTRHATNLLEKHHQPDAP